MMTSNQSNQLNSLVRNECNLGSGSIIINKGSEFDDVDIKSKQSTQFTGKKIFRKWTYITINLSG